MTYGKDIDNCSFKGRIDRFRSRKWKTLAENDSFFLFRTSSEPVPRKDELLTEHVNVHFSVSENSVLPLGIADKFNLSDAHSGFYRLVLTEPDMGFGMHEYRRLFAETMMYNSRARKKKVLPEVPLSLLMDTPQLGYVAENECFFNVGSHSDIRFSHIRPLFNRNNSLPDTSRPVAMMDGPEDEGNLMIGISGSVGESLIRMYLDLELLQCEIDHDFLPYTDWYYRDVSRWVRMDAVNVLRDDTEGLMHSGAVILQLPFCIAPEMADPEGVFWLCVAVHAHLDNCSEVHEVYLNVAEAEPDKTEEPKLSVPGLVGYKRIAPLVGTRPEEDEAEVRTRIRERIAHRHRLLLPHEYEQMVLQEFPDIVKVKCFPRMDSKRQDRNCTIEDLNGILHYSLSIRNFVDTHTEEQLFSLITRLLPDQGSFIVSYAVLLDKGYAAGMLEGKVGQLNETLLLKLVSRNVSLRSLWLRRIGDGRLLAVYRKWLSVYSTLRSRFQGYAFLESLGEFLSVRMVELTAKKYLSWSEQEIMDFLLERARCNIPHGFIVLLKKIDIMGKNEEDFKMMRGFTESADSDSGCIEVKNAGVVLIAPFLSMLPRRLDFYLSNDKKMSLDNSIRFVFIVQYLVYGKEQEWTEDELCLNKILAGIENYDKPLPRSVALTENEIEICNELMKVIKVNWDKMRNTSAEAVRFSFFQRRGILSKSKSRKGWWNIKVEEKAFDVLLDSVPWSFGIIRYPWMEHAVMVEWR